MKKVSLKESKAKYYHGHACYHVVYDHNSGSANRYTVYFRTASDPLVIGRELDLKTVRESLIPKYENYLDHAFSRYNFVYTGDRATALSVFTAVNGKIYQE